MEYKYNSDTLMHGVGFNFSKLSYYKEKVLIENLVIGYIKVRSPFS